MAKYKCDFKGCDYRAVSNYKLIRHKTIHLNKRHKYLINRHLRTHQMLKHPREVETEDWINCSKDECDYRTKSQIDLREHKKSIHLKRFK